MTTAQHPSLRMPEFQRNPEGAPRRVGVELEMNGLTLDRLAQLVAKAVGAQVDSRGRYEGVLGGDPADHRGHHEPVPHEA